MKPILCLTFLSVMLIQAFSANDPHIPSYWTEGYVLANGIRIHYWRTGGEKQPLIMAHGYSDDGLCWTAVATELEDQYDIILPDARGFGLTDPPSQSEPADVQVEDLAEFIEALDLEKPIIMGHSMGSASVAWFAARYPDVPKASILVDPRLVPRTPEENARRNSQPMEARVEAILEGNKQVAAILKNGQLIHVEGAGHSVHRDQPERFHRALTSFLNNL